jgi:hypothetical protein
MGSPRASPWTTTEVVREDVEIAQRGVVITGIELCECEYRPHIEVVSASLDDSL